MLKLFDQILLAHFDNFVRLVQLDLFGYKILIKHFVGQEIEQLVDILIANVFDYVQMVFDKIFGKHYVQFLVGHVEVFEGVGALHYEPVRAVAVIKVTMRQIKHLDLGQLLMQLVLAKKSYQLTNRAFAAVDQNARVFV